MRAVAQEMTSGAHIYKWSATTNVLTYSISLIEQKCDACLRKFFLHNHWIYYYIAVYFSVVPSDVTALSWPLSHWLTTKEFPLSDSSLSCGREIKQSFYGKKKHFKNQKLVEQMLTGNWGKTLSLYSTAHLISDCIINTTDFMVPYSVTVVTNPGHEEDTNKVCSS